MKLISDRAISAPFSRPETRTLIPLAPKRSAASTAAHSAGSRVGWNRSGRSRRVEAAGQPHATRSLHRRGAREARKSALARRQSRPPCDNASMPAQESLFDAAPAVVQNNLFLGGGSVSSQVGSLLSFNYASAAPCLVDLAAFDSHLAAGAPCVDAGMPPGDGGGFVVVRRVAGDAGRARTKSRHRQGPATTCRAPALGPRRDRNRPPPRPDLPGRDGQADGPVAPDHHAGGA